MLQLPDYTSHNPRCYYPCCWMWRNQWHLTFKSASAVISPIRQSCKGKALPDDGTAFDRVSNAPDSPSGRVSDVFQKYLP
ncbi:MAG: hypothetical protein U5L09_11240 [Bacteroidales bacterium]|nr:hypothetical protein [Bacteroidales bacterium]